MNKKNERPLISVIVPVYNDEKYLWRCLESILQQSYKQLEIVLVDDGSTDNSGSICDICQQSDKRVKVIHKENGGTVSARRCGLDYAKGMLISFVDGDDWIACDMYENLMEAYLSGGCPDVISTGIIYEYPGIGSKVQLDGAKGGGYKKKDIQKQLLPVLIHDFSTCSPCVLTSVCTKLIERNIAKKAMQMMDDSLSMGEDGAYVYFIMSCAESAFFLPKAFYHYEQHTGSQNFLYGFDSFQKLFRLKKALDHGMDIFCQEQRGEIQEQIDYYVWSYLHQALREQFRMDFHLCFYLFPFARCKKDAIILLYGAGAVGKAYEKCLRQTGYAKKMIWTDQNAAALKEQGLYVIAVEEALEQDYDYLVVAIEECETAQKVMTKLIQDGVDRQKLVWERPARIFPYG